MVFNSEVLWPLHYYSPQRIRTINSVNGITTIKSICFYFWCSSINSTRVSYLQPNFQMDAWRILPSFRSKQKTQGKAIASRISLRPTINLLITHSDAWPFSNRERNMTANMQFIYDYKTIYSETARTICIQVHGVHGKSTHLSSYICAIWIAYIYCSHHGYNQAAQVRFNKRLARTRIMDHDILSGVGKDRSSIAANMLQ